MRFDTANAGLETMFTKYGVALLDEIFRRNEDPKLVSGFKMMTSRDAYRFLWAQPNEDLHVSRASVINFLSDMADEGILNTDEETCKGGSRVLYSPKMSRRDFEKFIIRTIVVKLGEIFPNFQLALWSFSSEFAQNP